MIPRHAAKLSAQYHLTSAGAGLPTPPWVRPEVSLN